MKVLIITNLYPNKQEPTRGMFNRQQILELCKLCELKIIAPIPWALPIRLNKKGYLFSRIPEREVIDGLEVYHPRYFMIPKVGRSLYGLYFFLSLLGKVKAIYKNFKFDLIFATFAYPDGFGSFLIAKVLNKPIVIKVHGTDINSYTRYFLRRKMIAYALKNSNKVIAVSSVLREKLEELGVAADKIAVIPNGIDQELFKPLDKGKCRRDLNLPSEGKLILFAGNLKREKGLLTLIDAFYQINIEKNQNYLLVIVGDGYLRKKLEKKVNQLGLKNWVRFAGAVSHDKIPLWMNTCDVFCLPSLNEGCPNVLLEALACGKPIVASSVGGIPEIITGNEFGFLVPPRNAMALASGIQKAFNISWNSKRVREISSKFTWQDNAKNLFHELHG